MSDDLVLDALLAVPQGTVEHVERPDGTRLRCVYAGTGPTVLLAHGYLLDLALYNRVFPRLVAAGRRVIAFDQRGHGASTIGRDGLGSAALAGDYAALLTHFDVQGGTLIGHSMGAFLSILLCLNEPALARRRLQAMVLIGGNAGSVARGSLQNRLQIPLLKSGLLRRLWARPGVGGSMVKASLFGREPDPRWVEATRQILLRQLERLSFPMLSAMLDEDYYGRLGEISVPTTVLCGDLDRTCPRWHSERLGSALPSARLMWLPDAGHMVPYEAPDAILAALDGDAQTPR